jgi:hypothetical protein
MASTSGSLDDDAGKAEDGETEELSLILLGSLPRLDARSGWRCVEFSECDARSASSSSRIRIVMWLIFTRMSAAPVRIRLHIDVCQLFDCDDERRGEAAYWWPSPVTFTPTNLYRATIQ